MFGVEEIISGKKLPDGLKEVILKLPELFGSVSHLDYVSGKITLGFGSSSKSCLERAQRSWFTITAIPIAGASLPNCFTRPS